jgi:hypothetical protein
MSTAGEVTGTRQGNSDEIVRTATQRPGDLV